MLVLRAVRRRLKLGFPLTKSLKIAPGVKRLRKNVTKFELIGTHIVVQRSCSFGSYANSGLVFTTEKHSLEATGPAYGTGMQT